MYREYRHGRSTNDTFGHAAQQEMPHRSAPVRAEHHQINVFVLHKLNDLIHRRTDQRPGLEAIGRQTGLCPKLAQPLPRAKQRVA